jgi:hypothetical protein
VLRHGIQPLSFLSFWGLFPWRRESEVPKNPTPDISLLSLRAKRGNLRVGYYPQCHSREGGNPLQLTLVTRYIRRYAPQYDKENNTGYSPPLKSFRPFLVTKLLSPLMDKILNFSWCTKYFRQQSKCRRSLSSSKGYIAQHNDKIPFTPVHYLFYHNLITFSSRVRDKAAHEPGRSHPFGSTRACWMVCSSTQCLQPLVLSKIGYWRRYTTPYPGANPFHTDNWRTTCHSAITMAYLVPSLSRD